MSNANNGYRYAELAVGESLQSPDVCDCCGREGLKKTIKLVNPMSRVVWFGVGCAARALSVGIEEVRAERKGQIDLVERNQELTRRAESDEAMRAWFGFLQDEAGPGEVFAQIERLGGTKAAFALFTAKTGRTRRV